MFAARRRTTATAGAAAQGKSRRLQAGRALPGRSVVKQLVLRRSGRSRTGSRQERTRFWYVMEGLGGQAVPGGPTRLTASRGAAFDHRASGGGAVEDRRRRRSDVQRAAVHTHRGLRRLPRRPDQRHDQPHLSALSAYDCTETPPDAIVDSDEDGPPGAAAAGRGRSGCRRPSKPVARPQVRGVR